jgi:hypothetical protein
VEIAIKSNKEYLKRELSASAREKILLETEQLEKCLN